MDDTAGICLRPSASLLVAFDGEEPVVVTRSRGFRTGSNQRIEPQVEPVKRKGIAGFLDRISGANMPEKTNPNLFPFDEVADLLRDLKSATESTAPHRVVIAVPAYAHDEQRQSVVDGATAAGWEVLGLVNEPVAAAMASGVLRDGDGTTVVYDLDEGRFDVTVVSYHGITFEVLSTNGKSEFDDATALPGLLDHTEAPSRQALKDAGLNSGSIDSVVLVGEKSRETLTREFVAELFGKAPLTRHDPEEIVGVGAAVQASLLNHGATH
jgi:molecular chaperone DnaK (HSP70)